MLTVVDSRGVNGLEDKKENEYMHTYVQYIQYMRTIQEIRGREPMVVNKIDTRLRKDVWKLETTETHVAR